MKSYFRTQIRKNSLILLLFALLTGCGLQQHGDVSQPAKTTSVIPPKKEAAKPFETIDLGNLGKPFVQPDLSGQSMVWAGDKQGELHDADAVYLMDLSDQKKQLMATSIYSEQPHISCPQISSTWITWLDSGINGNKPEYTLFALNRQSGKKVAVSNFSAVSDGGQVIAWANLQDDRLVWFEPSAKSGSYDLKMRDLSQGNTKTIVTVKSSFAPAPYQYGDTLVWSDALPNWKGLIETLDLSNGTRKSFEVDGPFGYPTIFGHSLLYSPKLSEDGIRDSLVVVNLQNSQSVTIHANQPFFWSLGDGFVAWSENGGQTTQVVAQSLAKDSKPIAIGDGALPYVFGKQLIWQSPRGEHIYYTQIHV